MLRFEFSIEILQLHVAQVRKAAVESAAQYLNAQIKVVQDQSKVIGIEHTVVLAALNMANELISDQPMEVDEVVINRVRGLRQRIAAAITED